MRKSILLFAWFLYSLSTYSQNTDTLTSSKTLEEVIILANKFKTFKKEQANHVQIITAKEIALQNAPNTADLLSTTGKAFVQKSQAGGGSPILRGFEANKILVVVDGIKMNNAIFRGGHLQNILRVDQNSLESAELVFGPGSILYGSDGLGGTISLRTKLPAFETKNMNSFLRYSSAINENTSHLDFNIGNHRLSSWSSLTYSDFGDIIQGANRTKKYPEFGKRLNFVKPEANTDQIVVNRNPNVQIGSAYSQFDIIQKIAFKQNQKISHLFNFQYSQTGNVNRYDRLTDIANNKLRFAEWYYGPEKRLLISQNLKLNSSRFYQNADITLGFQDIEESRNVRSLNSKILKNQTENVKVFSLNADFLKELTDLTLQYGFEGVLNFVNSKASFRNVNTNKISIADTRYPSGGSSMNSIAAYTKYKSFYFDRKVILDAGLRLSHYDLKAKFTDKSFFNFPFENVHQKNSDFSSSVGLILLPNSKTKYSFLASQGFRVPNVDDLGKVFDSTPGILIVPNPEILPEKSFTFELGIERRIKKFNFELVYFSTLLNDAIALSRFTRDGKSEVLYQNVPSLVMANQNKGTANIVGLFAGLSITLNKNIEFNSSYNFTRGVLKDTLNTPLDHIPPAYGRTVIKLNRKDLNLEFYSNYNAQKNRKDYSPSGEDNLVYATADGSLSWITFNFKSNYKISKKMEVQLGLENIFDKNYRPFASGISAPGRNFIGSVRFKI
jgi:hemoglobin/transferrin/lactoferrin receptor protein